MAAPIAIKLRCATWAELDALYERHIKRRRFLLRKTTGAPLGTPVRLEVTLPTGEVVSFAGHVAEIRADPDPRTRLELDEVPAPLIADLEAKILHARAVAPAFGEAEDTVDTAAPDFDRGAVESDLADALVAELEALRLLNPFQILAVEYDASPETIRHAFAELAEKYEPEHFANIDHPRVRALAAEIHGVILRAYGRIARPSTSAGAPDTQPPPLPPPPEPPSMHGPSVPAPIAPGSGMQPSGSPGPQAVVLPSLPIVTFSSVPQPIGEEISARTLALTADSLFGDMGDLPRHARASRPLKSDSGAAARDADRLLQAGHHDQAVAAFEGVLVGDPENRGARIGRLLALGLKQIAGGDRSLAAPFFESVLEIDPRHERAARELASLRRSTTENRRGLLAKLLGRKQ